MWDDVGLTFREGAHRVALSVAGFLPGVLIMLLVLAFAVAIAFLVRWALRRSLAGIEFDRRVHRWGLTSAGEWTPRNSPTAIAAHAGFWFVLLVGFLAGLKALGTEVTDTLSARTLNFIPNLLASGLIFLLGLVVARFLQRTTLINAVNMQLQQARLISLAVKWMVLLFTVAIALHELGVGGAVLTVSFALVFGGIVLAVALAVGLGAREPRPGAGEPRWPADRPPPPQETDDIHHM
jgi:hypothetical protein